MKQQRVIRTARTACTGLALLCLAAAPASAGPWQEHEPRDYDIQPGPGVTAEGWISAFHEPLADTVADTPYFVLEGDQAGGTLFILGGTHASEPAGIAAAVLLVETAVVERGTLIVVPYGNALAVTPEDRTIEVETPAGTRRLVYGVRRSVADLHEDDPDEEYEGPSGATFDANEGRNLNRVWPGDAEGTGTEQIAHALIQLMNEHKPDLAFDLHETQNPWGSLAWTLAGRSDHEDLIREACRATNAAIELDLTRPRIDDDRDGLSRVEWGPATNATALLTETVMDNHTPIETRVAFQIEWVLGVLEIHNAEDEQRAVHLSGVPRHDGLLDAGLGKAFAPAR